MHPSPVNLLLLTHLAATLFMVGLIWFVQVVHYPLFAQVGEAQFAGYGAEHSRLTTWVVAGPMLLELATALLLYGLKPESVSRLQLTGGLALLVVIWLSTIVLQVPRHNQLAAGYDDLAGRALVATNWIRTLAWSARGLLVLAMTAGQMR